MVHISVINALNDKATNKEISDKLFNKQKKYNLYRQLIDDYALAKKRWHDLDDDEKLALILEHIDYNDKYLISAEEIIFIFSADEIKNILKPTSTNLHAFFKARFVESLIDKYMLQISDDINDAIQLKVDPHAYDRDIQEHIDADNKERSFSFKI
ncbi:MAG: hypothetical protein PVJ67_03865 [Candidatus Pacearchaeota archaeon]